MRKITCQTCTTRYVTRTPVWVVFNDVRICETCRLAVIDYMRLTGFSLSRFHCFTEEFLDVESGTRKKESS